MRLMMTKYPCRWIITGFSLCLLLILSWYWADKVAPIQSPTGSVAGLAAPLPMPAPRSPIEKPINVPESKAVHQMGSAWTAEV